MADVQAFRAVRYARPSAAVVAPPYDIVGADALEDLRSADPYNVVHLTLDPSEERAGETFRSWLAEGVLVEDEAPSMWRFEQDYEHPLEGPRTARGVCASLAAEPYDTGVVLRHERTHEGPRESRLRLLRAARAQLEPILLLHEGVSPTVEPTAPPDLEGSGTRLWRLAETAALTDWFAGRQLLIADGHHRYEAALALGDDPATGAHPRALAVLVSADDDGLGLLPTHRIAGNALEPPVTGLVDPSAALRELGELSHDTAAAAVVAPAGAWIVRGEPGELDTELVERLTGAATVRYTPSTEVALQAVADGDVTAFLLRPPRVADVFARAREGRPMPQKSTYFLPKLISGLVFHPL